jgi:ABC-type glycerol-3-phosphate transport system substrate-binding protein
MGVTDFLSITKRSPNVAEAWALSKHLTDKETGIRLGEGGITGASGTSGGRKDVFHSERLLANPLHKVWIEAAEQALPLKVPWNFLGEEHQRVLNEGMNPILRGEVAVNASTLAELDRKLQVVLDRPRPGK